MVLRGARGALGVTLRPLFSASLFSELAQGFFSKKVRIFVVMRTEKNYSYPPTLSEPVSTHRTENAHFLFCSDS